MTQFAYLLVQSHTGGVAEWRVHRAMVLEDYWQDSRGAYRHLARMLYVDETNAIRIEEHDHYQSRCGFESWVYATEFPILYDDLRSDWTRYKLWPHAIEDTTRIEKNDFPLQDPARAGEVKK
jgi:hypothetical protein